MIITERDIRLAHLLRQSGDVIHKTEKTGMAHPPKPQRHHASAKKYRMDNGDEYTLNQLRQMAPFRISLSALQKRLTKGMTPQEAISVQDIRAWKREAKAQQV